MSDHASDSRCAWAAPEGALLNQAAPVSEASHWKKKKKKNKIPQRCQDK